MNERQSRRPSGASLVPPYTHWLGRSQARRTGWLCPPGLAPLGSRTFMRSRFFDNFVLRSAAMLASASLRHAALARYCVRQAVVLRSARFPTPALAPPLLLGF